VFDVLNVLQTVLQPSLPLPPSPKDAITHRRREEFFRLHATPPEGMPPLCGARFSAATRVTVRSQR